MQKIKASVQKELFFKSLVNIQSIVNEKNKLLGYFLLDLTGEPFIYATDLNTSIKLPVKIKTASKGVLAIPAKPLMTVVKSFEEDITIEETEDYNLKLTSGKSSIMFNCLDPQQYPKWPQISKKTNIVLPGVELKKLIDNTIYATASDDHPRYVFNCVLFHIQQDTLTSVATNGHRLALHEIQINGNTTEFKLILPRKSIASLKKLVKDEQEISIMPGERHVLITTPSMEFAVRLVEGVYPDYQQVIPKQFSKRVVVNKTELQKALERVSVFSTEGLNAVKFTIEGNTLRISAAQPDLGSATEELDIEYDGEPFIIGFNVKYVLEAIEVMSTDDIIADFDESDKPALFRGNGDRNHLSIIMPMRIW